MSVAFCGTPVRPGLRCPVLFFNIHDVVEYGEPIDLARWLRANPGDANARLCDDDTLLLRAVRAADRTAIATMLEFGATPCAQALSIAVSTNQYTTAHQLLARGSYTEAALADAVMHCRTTGMFTALAEFGARAGAVDADGRTLLHHAARRGNADLARHLVGVCRLDPRMRCGHGLTPFQYADMSGVADYPMPEVGPWPAVNPAREYFAQFEP